MIEKIEHPSAFDAWQGRDVWSVRILALLKSYGCGYPFASFYRQIVDGKTVAILSKLDSDYTLCMTDGADNEELVHFFCTTGFSTILTDDKLVFSARYDEGVVMQCDKKHEYSLGAATLDEYPKLMDLYNFVDYNARDFQAWYVDISHRVRHGTAKAYTLTVDDNIIASGILSSIISDYAVLSAVRTVPEFRHMGYGSALVAAICSDVRGRVYILRDEGLNEDFYSRLGFENIGKWRLYR